MDPLTLALLGGSAYLSSKSSKKDSGSSAGSVSTQPLMPAWQMALGQDLSGWAQKFLKMYNPGEAYGGKLSAGGPTGIEGAGLEELSALLSKPATGDLFSAAKGQVMDTLSGKYADPSTSPFIQNYTKLAQQNLRDSINTERGQRGARGTYYTQAGIDAESKLGERTQNYLNTLIGDFMNSERGRQLTAVGSAKDLEAYGTNASLTRVAASQQYGGLQRMLEQADLERQYNAWLNQRNELSQVPGVAGSVFGRNIPNITTTTSPAPQTSGQDIAPWISLAMKFLPGMLN